METWTAARVFEEWFRRLYPPELRTDDAALAVARATDANPAGNPHILAELDEIAEVFARLATATLDPNRAGRAGRAGQAGEDLVLDFSDASIHRLGTAVDRPTRDAIFAASAPGDPDAPLVRLVVHGAIYVGACAVKNHGGRWGVRRPLWESVVHLASRAGVGALVPFQWWLKSLADHEIDRGGLVSRYRHYVERATARPEDLPPIVTTHVDRKLPTLHTVRYDTLHRYLRAHLAELADLGRDFPTAEEFHAMGFLELDFVLLGGGRMLLMHGRGRRGLHLLWLDHEGFSHAAFFPANPGDPHRVEVSGDRLIVAFQTPAGAVCHEMLWWG